jgi:5-methylcytosine-specific restriction endonuclease McrA
MRKISIKRAVVLREERRLSQELLEKCEGLCQKCGKAPDWRGLGLHHKLFKSRGGKSTEENCELLCSPCHEAAHFRREG